MNRHNEMNTIGASGTGFTAGHRTRTGSAPGGEPKARATSGRTCPVIKGHGDAKPLSDAAEQPKPDSKVVLDIRADETSVGGVLRGLDRAAGICNRYATAGAGLGDGLRLAVVLHGPATKAALTHEAYERHTEPYARHSGVRKNRSLALIQELAKAGVEVFVCGEELARHGFTRDEVAEGVTVAASAVTVNVNKQLAGYAYVPFH